MEDRIEYFERMLADNPDNPTGLLALAKEYNKVDRHEDEAAALQRYVSTHEDEGTSSGVEVPSPNSRGSDRPRSSDTAVWPKTCDSP